MTDPRQTSKSGPVLSRRAFLGASAVVGGLVLVGCDPVQQAPPGVTPLPAEGARFFTPSESRQVDAIIARIIPGSPEDPGAREAGVLTYIDSKLATHNGFAEKTYIEGPFVDVVSSGASVAAGVGALAVAEDQLYRYGYQSGVLPQEVYRKGLPALDVFTQSRFGAPFTELSDDEQDAALGVLDQIQQNSEPSNNTSQSGGEGSESQDGSDAAAGAQAAKEAFGDLDAGEFFSTLRTDTIEGMFADPSYGGNQGLVGWELIGYPGPQRAYSPAEMLAGTRRGTQPLRDLPPMNPDRHDSHSQGALQQPMKGVKDG